MANVQALLGLLIATILISILLILIRTTQKKQQIRTYFSGVLFCLLICCIGLISQILFYNINPLYFDYFVYIGTCFLPVFFLLFTISFTKTKFKFTRMYLLLFVIPIISLIILWTNNYHHLFYKIYSVNFFETLYGPYFYLVHSTYTYLLFFIGLLKLMKYSIRNAGFFSKQSLLIASGSIICILINIFGTFGIIKMSIYITPISFTVAMLFYALAIFKFDFLKVAPIALQRIVDRISDAYIILNDDMVITDFNKTFLTTFQLTELEVRNINILSLLTQLSDTKAVSELLINSVASTKFTDNTVKLERYFPDINEYFNIEINSIKNNESYLGTLILFKNITQHKLDVQTIKDNQDMLIEKERLASLGQMIGRNCS